MDKSSKYCLPPNAEPILPDSMKGRGFWYRIQVVQDIKHKCCVLAPENYQLGYQSRQGKILKSSHSLDYFHAQQWRGAKFK
jgi:hypothetical protein